MQPHFTAAWLLSALPLLAQQAPPVFTTADYARAEKFMGYNTAPLVFGSGVRPTFLLDGDRFWYRVTRESGAEFMLADPAKGTKAPAFDHARIAAALSLDTNKLPFQTIDLTDDSVSFSVSNKRYKCTLNNYKCALDNSPVRAVAGRGGRGGLARSNDAPSPDKKKIAFIRDYNLW
ncbi:MAG TPA: hypothetical protein VNH18_04830, partial [Bryobacteraceae bacterium]|nr:hypothetical protein [Bryobacteraceae bacterium]